MTEREFFNFPLKTNVILNQTNKVVRIDDIDDDKMMLKDHRGKWHSFEDVSLIEED